MKMEILILGLTYAIYIAQQECSAIRYIDIPVIVTYSPPQPSNERSIMANPLGGTISIRSARRQAGYADERDHTIKTKLLALMDQMLYDTDRVTADIKLLLREHVKSYPYQAGILMSQIKRNRVIINEIFDTSVKHKDTWNAVDVLKFYETIVAVSIDTSNLIDTLTSVHMKGMMYEDKEEMLDLQKGAAAENAETAPEGSNTAATPPGPEASPPGTGPEPPGSG